MPNPKLESLRDQTLGEKDTAVRFDRPYQSDAEGFHKHD